MQLNRLRLKVFPRCLPSADAADKPLQEIIRRGFNATSAAFVSMWKAAIGRNIQHVSSLPSTFSHKER